MTSYLGPSNSGESVEYWDADEDGYLDGLVQHDPHEARHELLKRIDEVLLSSSFRLASSEEIVAKSRSLLGQRIEMTLNGENIKGTVLSVDVLPGGKAVYKLVNSGVDLEDDVATVNVEVDNFAYIPQVPN